MSDDDKYKRGGMDWDDLDNNADAETGGWGETSQTIGHEYGDLLAQAETVEGLDMNDDAAQFLAEYNEKIDQLTTVNDETGKVEMDNTLDYSYQGETDEVRQLRRIGSQSLSVQRGILSMIEGQHFEGFNEDDEIRARESFAATIGTDIDGLGGFAAAMLRQEPELEHQLNPRSTQDKATVMSMLSKTANIYAEKGPQDLPGHAIPEDRAAEEDARMTRAFNNIEWLNKHYLSAAASGTSGGRRKLNTLNANLVTRFMEGTMFEGSSSVMALPNETGVNGLVRTQGVFSSSQGTAFTRAEAAQQFKDKYSTYQMNDGGVTYYNQDENGFRKFVDGISDEDRATVLRNTPSLKNSLFPIDGYGKMNDLEKEMAKAVQTKQYDHFVEVANETREIFRQQLLSDTDISHGNKLNMAGFHTPYGEQAHRVNTINEALLEGATGEAYTDPERVGLQHKLLDDFEDNINPDLLHQQGTGAVGRAGIHGDRATTDLSDILDEREHFRPADDRDYIDDAYAKYAKANGQIADHTPEWYRARFGKITASRVGDLLTSSGKTSKSALKVVEKMAREQLGMKVPNDEFFGNSDTRAGKEGEEEARQMFIKHIASKRGDIVGDAYFTERKDMPGMGVSPDAVVYREDGSKRGLLELKYLTTKGVKGALNKYYDQMQFQMAIDETDTMELFALDRDTDDFAHEIVHANPRRQRQLLAAANNALEAVNKMTEKELKAMAQLSSDPSEQDYESAYFNYSEELDEPIGVFEGKGGKKVESKPASTESKMESQQAMLDQKHGEALRMQDAMNMKSAQESAQASAKATAQLQKFTASVGKAATSLAKLGLATGEGAMDTARFASSAGISVEQARGLEFMLMDGEGGHTLEGARAAVMAGSEVARVFNDPTLQASAMEDLAKRFAAIDGVSAPQISQLKGLDAQGVVALVAQLQEGHSPEVQRQIGSAIHSGFKGFGVNQHSAEDLAGATGYIDNQGHRDFTSGAASVNQAVQTGAETLVAASGYRGGQLSAGIDKVAGGVGMFGWARSLLSKPALVVAGSAAALGSTVAVDGAIKDAGGHGLSDTEDGGMFNHGIHPAAALDKMYDDAIAVPEQAIKGTGSKGNITVTAPPVTINNSTNVSVDPNMVKVENDQDGETTTETVNGYA